MRRQRRPPLSGAWNTGCRSTTRPSDTLFDYLPGVPVMLDPLVDEAVSERLKEIEDYYRGAQDAHGQPNPETASYKPLPPDLLYLTGEANLHPRLGASLP